MSSSTPVNSWQHLAEIDLSPPASDISPADEYERAQRLKRNRAQHRIGTDVYAFVGVQFMTLVLACIGLGAAAVARDYEHFYLIPITIVGLGWVLSILIAVDAAWRAIAHLQQLRWTWLLLASLPWAALGFESLVVVLQMLAFGFGDVRTMAHG